MDILETINHPIVDNIIQRPFACLDHAYRGKYKINLNDPKMRFDNIVSDFPYFIMSKSQSSIIIVANQYNYYFYMLYTYSNISPYKNGIFFISKSFSTNGLSNMITNYLINILCTGKVYQ